MDEFEARAGAYISQHQMLQKGDTVIVALSGGADSMALFHFLFSVQNVWGLRLRAAHVNHGLRVLLSEDEIREKVRELGGKITADYKNSNLMLVTVLKGAVVFLADLMRQIDVPAEIDFMVVSSYGSGVKSSGVVKIVKDLDVPLAGKDILIVEDILDSGLTLSYIKELLESRGPRSIRIATLLDKPSRRKVDLQADYIGFSVPDEFVIGYGLDYDEKYRNLPYIGILKPEVYSV